MNLIKSQLKKHGNGSGQVLANDKNLRSSQKKQQQPP